MKLINEKYQKLKPTFDYLSDEVVIAQAWKKTHSYMRTHNWYADTLALDISALGLELNLKFWAKDILKAPYPLELVPAAKSDEWVIDKELGWVPKASLKQKCEHKGKCDKEISKKCENFPSDVYCDKEIELTKIRKEKPPIRPLANLTIKDQTLASAAMLCLADLVEDAQGDCNEQDFFKAKRNKVYSYGNRLICDWEKGPAWFRWGNSQIYRKFFTDYQNFLKRPVTIGREVASSQGSSDLIYVVSLDLEKFYDNIDRAKLVQRLQRLAARKKVETDDAFWEAFSQIICWKWDKEAIKRAEELGISPGEGLPQGLVASGFFANAYMLRFDNKVGACIGKEIPVDENIILHDYCRYVDDLRLVISITTDDHYGLIQDSILKWIDSVLKDLGEATLQINKNKVSITALPDLDNAGSLARRVKHLQHELSGPADRDVLDGSMSVLEGMLTTPTPDLNLDHLKKDLAFAKLVKFDHDIRTDTLKRFAANRLENIMRNKRRMTEHISDEPGSKMAPIDNESELLAKKLIWTWMKDPSLALVLRKAIEIYPSPVLLEPVLEAIYKRCSFVQTEDSKKRDLISEAIVDYVLADIFRCCVDFHGFFQRIQYPRSANPEGVISLAGQYAQKALVTENRLPLFIKRQALLLLAVLQKPANLSEASHNSQELIQTSLHRILAGKNPLWHHQRFALYEIASQITNDPDMVVHLLMDEFKKQSPKERNTLVIELAKRGGPFWVHFWERLKKIDKELAKSFQWAAPVLPARPKRTNQRLLAISASPENPFTDEIALLKLAAELVSFVKDIAERDLPSPGQIEIVQNEDNKFDWQEIKKPGGQKLSLTANRKYPSDPRYKIPEWVTNSDDAKRIYWIGSILRSIAIGTSDFTSNRWKAPKSHGYKGLRTAWYKRRMGMMHSPETLVGEYATCSQWITELLMTCLQWPGFESSYILHEKIKRIETLDDFKEAVKMRLIQMEQLYCNAAGIPSIVTMVRRPPVKNKQTFRLVTVQPIMPKSGQITPTDPALNNEKVKIINRDHLARVCQLTYKTLLAKAKTENADLSENIPTSDLIVFPEFTVHPDDQDIIKRLADKTKAMVFAGLCLVERDGNYVNVARWFLPDFRKTGRQWTTRDQGKGNPTDSEKKLGVVAFRPCQHIIEVDYGSEGPYHLSGAICYDSTDLALASDLKGKTDLFIIVAHNRDVRTFDTLASALHYHMYQHVVVVNKGEFGGTTIQAPFKEHYDRIISHVHGNDQISINIADLDLAAFKRQARSYKEVKKKPANYKTNESYNCTST